MNSFRFTKFKVYKDSLDFRVSLNNTLNELHELKDFVLKQQLERALNSVILNIAEGSAKRSDRDLKRFLTISLGSLNEVVACLEIAERLEKIDPIETKSYYLKAEEIAKQLSGFIKKLSPPVTS